MSFEEMVPVVRTPSRIDELHLIQLLAEDLAQSEESTPFAPGQTYPLSPVVAGSGLRRGCCAAAGAGGGKDTAVTAAVLDWLRRTSRCNDPHDEHS
jgi:hypothetical protein